MQDLGLVSTYVEEEVARQLRLIEVAEELEQRSVTDVNTEIRDITHILENSQSKVIKGALKKKGRVLAVRLRGFACLLGSCVVRPQSREERKEKEERRGLGLEFAGHARKAGAKGLFHSDELPAYGITKEEVAQIRKELGVGEPDAFVLIADEEETARTALDAVIKRARQALVGVPEETRDPQPDGTTSYSRPLPGKARMYPETDVPPIGITEEAMNDIKADLPEMPEEKQARLAREYKISEQQVRQLVSDDLDDLFEELSREYGSPNIVAKTLLSTYPELRKEGVDTNQITERDLHGLFRLLKEGKFAKEGIPEILAHRIKENKSIEETIETLGLGSIDRSALEEALEEIINENMSLIKESGMGAMGALMGAAMAKLRGKADGKLVSEMLGKKIREKSG